MKNNQYHCVCNTHGNALFWGITCFLCFFAFFAGSFLYDGKYFQSWFSENFFIQLRITENFLNGFPSTFDQIQKTNGYSPIWQTILYLSGKLFDIKSTQYLIVIKTIGFIASLYTIFLFKKLISKLLNLSPSSLYCSCLLFTFLHLKLAALSLPISLTIIFFIFFIENLFDFLQEKKQIKILYIFLFASLCIINSFDTSIFFIGCIFTIFIIDDKYDLKNVNSFFLLKSTPHIVIGLLPLITYLLFNHFYFDMIIPTNYKSLMIKSDFSLNTNMFYQIFCIPILMYGKNPVLFSAITIPLFIIIVTYIGIIQYRKDKTPDSYDICFASIIIFPTIYYVLYSFLTHWKITAQSLYPIYIAGSFCIANFLKIADKKFDTKNEIIGLTISKTIFFSYFCLITIIAFIRPINNMSIAKEIAKITNTKQGIYAMGNHVGKTSYYSNKNIINLKASTSNAKHIKMIRAEKNINEIFKEYNVDYYIGTNIKEKDNCFFIEEPITKIAGTKSRKNTAWICDKKEQKIKVGKNNISIIKIK